VISARERSTTIPRRRAYIGANIDVGIAREPDAAAGHETDTHTARQPWNSSTAMHTDIVETILKNCA